MPRRRAHGEGTIFRRGAGWAAAIDVGSARPGSRRRRYVYGATQREVREKLDALRRQLDAGLAVGTSKGATVAQYLNAWTTGTLAEQVANGDLRSTTRDSYVDMVERHISPYVGRYRLQELRPPHLRTWLAELRQVTSARGRPLSARTIQLAHATLRRALNDAVRDELIPRNPAMLVRAGSVPRKTIEPLTRAEATALVAAAGDDRLYALWIVLMTLGLRRGEALALRWTDFDLDGATVAISRSLQRRRTDQPSERGKHRTELVETAPKTEGSVRVLALPSSLVTVLKHHRAQQRRDRLAAPAWVDQTLVFTTPLGTPIEPRNVYRLWHNLCDQAKVRRCRPHDLRHTAASFLLLQGADMRTVMEQLGHTRMATTSDLYAHVLEEVKRDAADRMDGLLRDLLP